MRIAAVALLLGCLAASAQEARAGGFAPLDWLCCGRHDSKTMQPTNVSQTSASTPMLARMKGGTARFLTSTKNLFVANKPAKTRGVTATYPASRPQPAKPGFFRRWFSSDPAPAPKTVKEWMSLEQIHP